MQVVASACLHPNQMQCGASSSASISFFRMFFLFIFCIVSARAYAIASAIIISMSECCVWHECAFASACVCIHFLCLAGRKITKKKSLEVINSMSYLWPSGSCQTLVSSTSTSYISLGEWFFFFRERVTLLAFFFFIYYTLLLFWCISRMFFVGLPTHLRVYYSVNLSET